MPSKFAYRLVPAFAAMIAACGAQAQTTPPPAPPPMFATTKVPGTENVYIFRYQGHQSMFVTTPAGVIAMADLSMAVKAAADKGQCWDTAVKEVKLPKYEKWGDYAQFFAGNVERYCSYWGRGY